MTQEDDFTLQEKIESVMSMLNTPIFRKRIGNEDIVLNDVYFEEESIGLYIYDWYDELFYFHDITKEEMIKLGLLEETPDSETSII